MAGARMRLGLLAALFVWLALACAAALPANATAQTLAWSAPRAVAGPQEHLRDVSCPAVALCVAVDSAGGVLWANDPATGTWTRSIPGAEPLTAVACSATELCVATDESGGILTATQPTGDATAWTAATIAGSQPLHDVACASSTSCVAVDAAGHAHAAADPTGGAAAWTPTAVSGNALTAVTCTVTGCVAGDDAGDLYVTADPLAADPVWEQAPLSSSAITGIACAAAGACAVVDAAGDLHQVDLGGSFATVALQAGALEDVACPAPDRCVAVSATGHAAEATGDEPVPVTGGTPLRAVVCPSTEQCVTVGDGGVLATAAPVPDEPPFNLTPPTLTGAVAVGATLTCTPGTWSGSPEPEFTFGWLRDGSAIASGEQYVVEEADRGHYLGCIVVAANRAGSSFAYSQPAYFPAPETPCCDEPFPRFPPVFERPPVVVEPFVNPSRITAHPDGSVSVQASGSGGGLLRGRIAAGARELALIETPLVPNRSARLTLKPDAEALTVLRRVGVLRVRLVLEIPGTAVRIERAVAMVMQPQSRFRRTGRARSGGFGVQRMKGTRRGDLLDGESGSDILRGLAGDDRLVGGTGNDTLDGGAGHDETDGLDGDDRHRGGAGDDFLIESRFGDDTLDGGAGNDWIFGGRGNDRITGGEGDDVINGHSGRDTIDCGPGDDVVLLNLKSERGPLKDCEIVMDEPDIVSRRCVEGGTVDPETMLGTAGPDVCRGEGGDDDVEGAGGDDELHGGSGNDRIFGRFGADKLFGDEGDDEIEGGRGRDTVEGGPGDDQLNGGLDNDRLSGGPGNDTILARGGGADRINCGPGRDTVYLDSRDRARGCEVRRNK